MKYALTYYDHSENLWPEGEMRELLKLWEESFRKQGWEPVVLSREDVKTHPRFDFFFEHFHNIPTTYPRTFTDACWLRWLAAAHFGALRGESSVGLFDMDCINYSFPPRDPEAGKMEVICSETPASIFLGAVLGSPQHFLDLCELFVAWRIDEHDFVHRLNAYHSDDLSVFVRMFETGTRPKPDWLIKTNGCSLFDNLDYRTQPLVHFGSGAMKARKCWPKHLFIRHLRKF